MATNTSTINYSLNLLNNLHEAIFESFDYDLTPKQLQILINYQPKSLIKELVDNDGVGVCIDNIINEISKKITKGLDYPFMGVSEAYKKRFFIKLNIRKSSYFEPIFRFK